MLSATRHVHSGITAYKRAHAKARVKAQDNNGSIKFRAANSTARQKTANPPLDNQLEEDVGDLKTLEGYFDNLAAAAVNWQGVLKQLMLNNTTLATINESLVDLCVLTTRSEERRIGSKVVEVPFKGLDISPVLL